MKQTEQLFATIADPHSGEQRIVPADILDSEEGVEQRDEALRKVARGIPPEWFWKAQAALREVAGRLDYLTAEAVWVRLNELGVPAPPEHRAMATVLRYGRGMDWITPTDRVEPTSLPWAHRRPMRVWRSLVFKA